MDLLIFLAVIGPLIVLGFLWQDRPTAAQPNNRSPQSNRYDRMKRRLARPTQPALQATANPGEK